MKIRPKRFYDNIDSKRDIITWNTKKEVFTRIAVRFFRSTQKTYTKEWVLRFVSFLYFRQDVNGVSHRREVLREKREKHLQVELNNSFHGVWTGD